MDTSEWNGGSQTLRQGRLHLGKRLGMFPVKEIVGEIEMEE